MKSIEYEVKLTSDGEPGTGLGGDTINAYVPRDPQRRPVLHGSHIKGLMRQVLYEIAVSRGWESKGVQLANRVFGKPSAEDTSDDAAISVHNAVDHNDTPTHQVTRTAISKHGVVKNQSLRTSESINRGAVFQGKIQLQRELTECEDYAWKLALLSISAVGGSRNRGAGQCVVTLPGIDETPGQLLAKLDKALVNADLSATVKGNQAISADLTSKSVVVELVYRAESPACFPELPDKTNVITSGFSVPASAVQGLIVSRLGREDSAFAEDLYQCSRFRAWPLQPCWYSADGQSSPANQELPSSLRISLTHQAAKYSVVPEYRPADFYDEAIEPYDARNKFVDAPLKASDGVLLIGADQDRSLWRASDMPQVLTSHGVRRNLEAGDDQPTTRNLFSVKSNAPMVWRGIAVMPEAAAEYLLKSLKDNPHVSLGKSRTVRGQGTLSAWICSSTPSIWQSSTAETTFIVQSPLLLGEFVEGVTCHDEFIGLINSWNHDLPSVRQVWAKTGILFGWNRSKGGFQPASRVVLPGSVIQFDSKINDDHIRNLFLSGEFHPKGREAGLGAISIHPGKATRLYEPVKTRQTVAPRNAKFADALSDVLDLRDDIQKQGARLPSVSQIRSVQQILDQPGPEVGRIADAKTYLKRQTEKTSKIWSDWEDSIDVVLRLFDHYDAETISRCLEVLADLARIDKKGN